MFCKALHCAVNALLFEESVFLRSYIKQKVKWQNYLLTKPQHLFWNIVLSWKWVLLTNRSYRCFPHQDLHFYSVSLWDWNGSLVYIIMQYLTFNISTATFHFNSICIIEEYQANRWFFWSSPQTWWLEHTLLVVGEVHTLRQMILHQPKTACPHLQMSEGHLNPPAIRNSKVKSEQCQLWSRACLWCLFILFLNHRCCTPVCPGHQEMKSIEIFPCEKKKSWNDPFLFFFIF